MSSLNKSPFLKIFLSYLPFIMLFFSVFNDFVLITLKLDFLDLIFFKNGKSVGWGRMLVSVVGGFIKKKKEN